MPLRESFIKPESYYSVLWHELGHSTGHPARLGRHKEGDPVKFGSQDYSKEELVAEMTAAFLCGSTGIINDMTQNTAYIESWLSALKNNIKWVVQAASQAQKAADYILDIHQSPELETS